MDILQEWAIISWNDISSYALESPKDLHINRFNRNQTHSTLEQRRLASTIGPDDTVDVMLFNLYVQIIYGNQSAEAFRNFFCEKNGHRIFYLPRQQKATASGRG